MALCSAAPMGAPWAYANKVSAASIRWILCLLYGLLWTTMGGAVDFGPEDANLKSVVETASPGTTVSLRPGVYNACNVAVPAGVRIEATTAGFSVFDCHGQDRHFVISNGVTGVTIHGLSLVNGIAAETADASGGCMFVGDDAGLKLVNVTLRNCSAPGSGGKGGAVFVGRRSAIAVDRCIIADGSAGSHGGGMYLDTNSSGNFSASTVRDCRAIDGGGLQLNGDVTLSLSNVTMERNAAFGSRGGALNAAGALGRNKIEVHGGKFVNNSAKEFGGMACLWPSSALVMDGLAEVVGSLSARGAGIFAREGSFVVMQDVVLRGGTASAFGGGVYVHTGSSLSVKGSKINNNVAATGGGGGVYAISFSIVDLLDGSSVSGNTAKVDAGGVYLFESRLSVNGSDVNNNSAGVDAGGVLALSSSTVDLLDGSSVSGNTAKRAGGLFVQQSTLVVSHSIINNNVATTGNGEGGGVLALSFSTVHLQDSASVNGNTAGNRAGGLFVQQSTLVVSGSIINNNVAATGNGGGVYALSFSTVHLQDSASVSGNTAGYRAGGLFVQQSTLVVSGSIINNNVAATGNGGGVYALSFSTVHLQDSASVSGNTAGYHAGGLFVQQSTLVVSGSIINNNVAATGNGGGVYAISFSTVHLQDSASVSGNTAKVDAGGVYVSRSSLSVKGSDVNNNSAGVDAGGVLAVSSSTVDLLVGSSVSGNTAKVDAGGVYLSQSRLSVNGSDVNNNSAGVDAGGVKALSSSTVDLLDGSSVSGNTAKRYAGGVYVSQSSLSVKGSDVNNNSAGVDAGGVYLSQSRLSVNGSVVNNNSAGVDAGGVLAVSQSTLVVSGSIINNNVAATGNGGGVLALSFSTVHLQDSASVSGNTVAKGYGGGLVVQQSTLVVSGSIINNNVAATGTGGGVSARSFSTVHLRDSASVSGNTAGDHGGGLYVQQSTLTSSKSAIDDNTAGADGGGVRAEISSTVTLGDGASVSRNTARGNGGGLSLLTTSSLATAGRVSVRDNAATGSSSVGGGIAASTSTVRLGSGSAAEIAHNRAAVDGGALALSENSTLADSGDPAFACLLTVHHNTASKGSGGGLVVSGDSSVTLSASTAVFSQNTAAHQGGGLFIRAGQSEFDSSKATYSIVAKVTFWRLDLVGNTATTGDGGGLSAYSLVNLVAGGHTNATGNSAARGGAAALVDASLIVQPGHKVTAQRNAAHSHGGAFALLAGGSLALLEAAACPTRCLSSRRGEGFCSPECMVASCNWDGGDCVNTRMDAAGKEAGQVCDRAKCDIFWQTNAGAIVNECHSDCFAAACDWSRELCVEPRANVRSCPLVDAAAYASIKTAQHSSQTGAPHFLTNGNSQGGFGRCNSACLPPAQPPAASSMLGAGIVGAGALRLLPNASGDAGAGWLHAALYTVDAARLANGSSPSFTLEAWIRVPSACASAEAATSANFSFVLAGSDYAVALRGMQVQQDGANDDVPRVFWPLFFWTAAPPRQCVAGPLVLFSSTGVIGDGPGMLARYVSEGPLSCSWILAPGGGGGGGFQDVTLFFTEFLLTSKDSLSLASCFDINCTSTTAPAVFKGATVPPPFVSTTPVMRVTLTKDTAGAWASSAGFTAAFAGTPALPSALPGLVAGAWHHVAFSVTASGSLSLVINGTQQLAQQLPWSPPPSQNPLAHGTDATAIGRGAPAWQNGGNFGQACLEVDELRLWTAPRTASDIASTMRAGCVSVASSAPAQLAACYSFDAAGDAARGGPFFPDASQNQIPASTAAHGPPHLPWCVNVDDGGKLRLDSSSTYGWSANDMWGHCSSKPRLPGAGFDYSESAMEEAVARRLEDTAAVLEHYPGCGDVPLRLEHNTAGVFGGALYYDSCSKLDKSCFVQGVGLLSGSRAILVRNNSARAGGAVFVECDNIGVSCAEAFGENNKIGSLPELPKVEMAGNSASAYGNNIATKATTMLDREANRSIIELVPGQELLSVAVKLYDSQGSLVKGSGQIIEMIICPDLKGACTALSASLPAVIQGFNSQTGLGNIQASVECALAGQVRMSTMLFSIRVVGADHINKISGRVLCNMCKKGQRMITHASRGTWSCETCLPGTYSMEPLTGVCFVCPSSATCVNGVPIFGASRMMGVIEMELAEGISDGNIRDALSIRIGIHVWQITSVLAHGQQKQRSSQKIEFTFVSNMTEIADLTARLKSLGAELGDPEPLGPQLAAGEVWEEIEGQYLLRTCPSGHYVTASSAQQQQCLPCEKGYECVTASCVTCTACAPGFYKAAVSTETCSPCPANTYVETLGSSALSLCQVCQPKSSTLQKTGQSFRQACVCDMDYYLIISRKGTPDEVLSCQVCPRGAVCGDGECALRNTDNFTCTDGKSSIVGTWILDNSTGQYKLTSCPAGYEMKTTAESSADLQQCLKCSSPSSYILRPDIDECQVCPPGLSCSGDARLAPKIEGSVWVEHGSFWKLDSCPAGYYVSPAGLVTLTAANAAQQQCLPCVKGEECVTAPCATCSPCQPGYYKAAVATDPCMACPANTYRTISGATELSNCLSCPAASTTARTASTSMDRCVCSNRMYSTKLADFTCMTCPAGAVCSDGSCALARDNWQCALGMETIKGNWMRSTQDGSFSLLGCPVGHRLNNISGHDVQACLQCPEGKFMLDPKDPSEVCQACPMTATCPKRGPPVFTQAAIEGSLSIDGDISNMDVIVRSLAAALGVDQSMIVLGDVAKARRGQYQISFQIFADESLAEAISQNMGNSFMDSFTANLAKEGVTATITPVFKPVNKEKKREGEVWEVEDGVYVLKSCPVGFLLFNSTIETQTCKECETGTYAISYDYGCDSQLCDSRPCLPCANGATCKRGSSPVWEHFVPKPLLLGSTILPWVTVITGGTRRVLFCDQENRTCAPLLAGQKGLDAAQEDHVWEFDESKLAFVLKSCPPGHQMVNSSNGVFNPTLQQCAACGAAKYIIDREAPCMDCPKGADCPDGAQFLPLAVGSVWEEVRASNGGIQKRLVQCPAGYELNREEALAIGDACTMCLPGSYRLIPSTLADLRASQTNSSSPQCTPCDPKAECLGSDIVEAKDGYWRYNPKPWDTAEMDNAFEFLPDVVCSFEGEVCLFPEGSFARSGWTQATMRCMRLPGGGNELFCARATVQTATRREQDADSNATTAVTSKAWVFRCAVGACANNNTCLQNRTGPVCGYCKPGFAMQTNGCSAEVCPSEETVLVYRTLLSVGLGLIVFILYIAFVARPVLPELDWLLSRVLQGIVFCISNATCLKDTQGDGAELGSEGFACIMMIWGSFKSILDKIAAANRWAKEVHLTQFVKILVTYFQILGSFAMFSITWPQIAYNMIAIFESTFKFEVVQMPGVSCLWHGVSFDSTLRLYTVAPLGVMASFILPLLVAVIRGYSPYTRHVHPEAYRWTEALDKFWTAIMFVLFAMYPAVSIATMRAFNCDVNLGLLKDDYRVVCPPWNSFTCIYSAFFFVLYPIGIPVFMNVSLRYMGVIGIVKRKMDNARFSAMLALFTRRACSVECQRIARLVGNVDHDPVQFAVQTEEQFKNLVKIQDDAELSTIIVEKLRAKGRALDSSEIESQGMDGTNIEQLCTFFTLFDQNGDGEVSLDEFRIMVRTSRQAATLFTGSEDLGHLSAKQMEALLIYDDWPTQHQGPGDTGENEGLGGLVNVVGKDVKKKGPSFSFELLDANGDGKITKEEYEKGFDLIDQDKDGFITEVEFKSVSNCWKVTVKLLDKDGDGKISRLEWNAGFALFDRDGDGKISKSEFYIVSGSGFMFEMLDMDGDGRLTQLEYNMGFDVLDKDQDGFLTRSEFGMESNLYFDKLDKDGDGRLSREEYNGGFAWIDTDRDGFISRTEFNEFIQLPPSEEEESEERADRRYALLDRDDPRVAEIDALVAELNEQHTKTGIPAYPTWKEDAEEAERIFLDTPDELPAWLERMRIKSLSKQEKRERVLQLAARLVREDIIAIPPQQWRSDVEEASAVKVEIKTPEEDRSAEAPPAPRQELTEDEAAVHAESAMLRRLGFIFIAYRVEYWWWEGMEMFRKFLLTCFLVFLPSDGPAQLATGALITFLFLLLNLTCRPFCTPGLNNLQSFSLISQFLTLFCGILIGYREAMQQTAEASTASDSAEQEESRIFGNIIVFINCGTLAFPLARKIMTGKHIEWMERIMFVLKLPFTCYMDWCGGKRRLEAKIAEKRRERGARLRAQIGFSELHPSLPYGPERSSMRPGSLAGSELFGNEHPVPPGQDTAIRNLKPSVEPPPRSSQESNLRVMDSSMVPPTAPPRSSQPRSANLPVSPRHHHNNFEPSVEPPRVTAVLRQDRHVEATGVPPSQLLIVD